MIPQRVSLLFTWLCFGLTQGDVKHVGHARYCWNGTDDFTARRNMTCATGLVLRYLVCVAFAARYTKVTLGCMNTNQSIVAQPNTRTVENHITAEQTTSDTGETSLGNVVSTRKYPTPETPSPSTDGPHSAGHGFLCMMFEYYVVTESPHEDTNMVKTKEILYTCDTENLCADRKLYEGYEAVYNGHQGTVYCCNSNNCNTHDLSLGPEHKHTCVDAIRDAVSWKGEAVWCAREDMSCLRERLARTMEWGQEEFIEERLSCDNANICAMHNLTKALHHSCKIILNQDTKIETEICCCKGDNCFLPDWFSFDQHQSGIPGPAKQPKPQSWQRTLLICIGVALAFLAVFVSICFIRRTRALKQQRDAELNRLAYKVVQSEEALDAVDDRDSVKILPPENR